MYYGHVGDDDNDEDDVDGSVAVMWVAMMMAKVISVMVWWSCGW